MASNFYQAWLLDDHQSELWYELGDFGRSEIASLYERLTGHPIDRGDRFVYRPSPSLIIRGEAQLLGLSDPRFGFRLLIHDKGGRAIALINLRRLGRMLDQFNGVKPKRVPISRRLKGPLDRHSLSSLADCLIPVPGRFSDYTQWCVARLPKSVTQHYGEDFALETVPFLRPLQFLSGGMCAQACSWMVDHYGYSFGLDHPVYALPDITWFAREPGEINVSLAGLSIEEMIRYYNVPTNQGKPRELRLSHQFLDSAEVGGGIRVMTDLHYKPAERAIQSYIRSGGPVLLRVDANRMKGRGHSKLPAMQNVYFANGLMLDRPVPEPLKRAYDSMHMIMLFGYNRKTLDFLFNDPGQGPFLKAELRHLFGAGCYLRPSSSDNFTFGEVLQPPSFLTVTPKDVRLPLLSAYDDLEENKSHGLFWISKTLGWPSTSFFPKGPQEQLKKGEGYFLLTRIAEISKKGKELLIEQPQVKALIGELCTKLEDWPTNYWVWLEVRGSGLLVWDAQRDPNKWDRPGSERRFLLIYGAICADGRLKWGRGDADPHAADTKAKLDVKEPIKQEHQNERLIPALITSFARDGLVSATKDWEHYGVAVDIYCYQRDEAAALLPGCCLRNHSPIEWVCHAILFGMLRLRYLLPRRIEWDWNARPRLHRRKRPRVPMVCPDVCICDWLAQKSNDVSYVERAAKAIANHLPRGEFPCAAVTTFFPELASCDPAVQRRGIQALSFVLRLVELLNNRHSCKIETVELVAGTVVSELYWEVMRSKDSEARGAKENRFSAKSNRAQARAVFCSALREVASEIPSGVRLALELEPGALGLIANYEDLVAFHDDLSDPKSNFGDRIGFNCDIGHFELAGIKPETLLSDPSGPISRIVGFHVSDFGNGHFQDLVPGVVHKKSFFSEWRRVCSAAVHNPINKHRSAIHISLELERANNTSTVSLGIERLKEFFTLNR